MRLARHVGICVASFALIAGMRTRAGAQDAPAAASQTTPAASQPAAAAQPDAASANAAEVTVAAGGTIRGTVRAGSAKAGTEKPGPEKAGVPLPGVSITATNTLTGERYTTVTDSNGAFAMQIPKDGRYVVKSELAAFAIGTKSVLLNATSRQAEADLDMQLASRVKDTGTEAIAGGAALGLTGRGTQALSLLGAAGGAQSAGVGGGQVSLPSASQGDNGLDNVTVSGNSGSTSAAFNFEAARQSQEDDRALQGSTQARGGSNGSGGGQGGGPGGFGFLMGGRPPGGGGSGAFRRFNPNAIHGSAVYQLTNSALNARNFAVDGQPVPQPAYGTNRYGLVYSGPVIPKLLESKKDFLFLALIGNHGSTLYDQSSNVPTAAERGGDFSALLTPVTGTPVQLYNPAGGTYAGNIIPACAGVVTLGCISPTALALLPYIPLPNETQTSSTDPNYRTLQAQHTNTDQLSARYVHNFGSGGTGMRLPMFMQNQTSKTLTQNLNANFNFQHTAEDEVALFPGFGGKDQLYQYVLNLSYVASKGNWTNTLNFAGNKTDSEARNYFTGTTNVAGNAGIDGVGLTPFFYGLPSLQFSGYGSGVEQQPSSRIQQVAQLSESVGYIYKSHNIKFGGDVRRIFLDVIGGVQGTGALTFSGFATAPPGTASTTGGNSFADFLIGVPQQGKLQAPCTGSVPAGVCTPGSPTYKLRSNVWNLFAQDTWRATPSLTLLYGLRYEYFSPYSEEHDRIANLDPNSDFTQVAVVTPNDTGPYNGKYSHSLVNAFRGGVSPRIGVAWKAAKNTVVRAGYGINYNTSVYGNFVQDLAYQRPFSLANNNTQSVNTDLKFTTTDALTSLGGNCTSPPCITNNYAVDKNYRMGYVQGWNLDIQQTLGKGYVLNVGYNGSKGTHLDGLLAPNSLLSLNGKVGISATTANAQVFDYEVSQAQSNFNALAVRLRKRLQNGIAIGATYTYSHSIDDASEIGGGTAVVAQLPRNLVGDLGNSSFDQRHVLKGDFTYELPFGPNGKLLNNGNWVSHALAGLQLYGSFNFATGEPLNPYYAAVSAEAGGGVTGSLRPDRVPGTSLEGGPSQLNEWFNLAAFSPLPPASVTGYGNAARNSIPGPGTREFDTSFSKYVSFGGTKSLEFRASANNVFNVVQYNAVESALDSFNAGHVLSAASMRNVVMILRYRF